MSALLPFLSALLLYLATPGPGLAILAWIALVPLFVFCRRTSPARAAAWGLAAGTLYHLLLVYWVTISMETYGGLAPLISWPVLFLLALYMALYFSLFSFIISKFGAKSPLLWLGPLLWVGLDYLRGHLFTGFPWMDLGYTQYRHPVLIQTADIFGHHAITFALVLTNILVARLVMERAWFTRHKIQTSAALLLLAMFFGYSSLRYKQVKDHLLSAPTLPVAVVQANIDQALKWQKVHKKISLDQHLQLTRQARADNDAALVIWPETALTFYPGHDPLMDYVEQETVASSPFHLLTGAPYVLRRPTGDEYYNSALLLSPEGQPDIYFKQHLVPFGEYIPLRSILPIPRPIVESMGDFTAGTSASPLDMGNAKIGVLICVEAIFPDLARRQTALGGTILTNITNDAWFGASSAPIQHLAMATFRSVENRRSMGRAANTGISAFILPSGEILARTDLFTQAMLTAHLPLLSSLTFFTRIGFLFPLFCLAACLLLIAAAWKKNPSP